MDPNSIVGSGFDAYTCAGVGQVVVVLCRVAMCYHCYGHHSRC